MCLPACGFGLSHGVVGVDPAVPEAGIVSRRTEVLGGVFHALTMESADMPWEASSPARLDTKGADMLVPLGMS